jgi:hypothetical protein
VGLLTLSLVFGISPNMATLFARNTRIVCFLVEYNGFIVLPFLFPRRVASAIAGLEEAKNLAGKSPPPDSDPFSDAEF